MVHNPHPDKPIRPSDIVMPDTKIRKDAGFCPTCREPVGEFRDRLSVKEYGISGMCQKCQDSVFGK